MKNKIKSCYVCGRTDKQNKLTAEDKRNNLHESDVILTHCSDCGARVCGFCNQLGVCCESFDYDPGDDEDDRYFGKY